MNIENLSPYQRWCIERGYPIPKGSAEELENGMEENQFYGEWMNQQAELQLIEMES